MRLRDLDGQFVGHVTVSPKSYRRQGDQVEGAQGVLFQCPACAAGKPVVVDDDGSRGVAGAHYVLICFANPVGAPVAPAEFDGNPRWQMSGTSIDSLTLSPSVNLDVPHRDGTPLGPDECRWHGWVQQGDAR